ncbi:MAG TPA: hypothetical protein VFK44_11280 [Bacillales bacterium]|nr:hypothetical protein [Bacillales bacterium]
MYVFASFDHSNDLELALADLTATGVSKNRILAVPIERRKVKANIFDTIHSSDGLSFIDLGMVLGTAFSVIGASYGFVLPAGPIVWGVIGALLGFVVGISIRMIMHRDALKKYRKKRRLTEVIVLVHCIDEAERKQVVDKLWQHHAFGVGTYPGFR